MVRYVAVDLCRAALGGNKKIVCLLGSPRKRGNSSTIAERFRATAKGLGAEIRVSP